MQRQRRDAVTPDVDRMTSKDSESRGCKRGQVATEKRRSPRGVKEDRDTRVVSCLHLRNQ